jgi:Lon protease-like protein
VGNCSFGPFTADLSQEGRDDIPRDRLLAALKTYLSSHDMSADWDSVMSAPAEALVNALAMMCPFDPAGKQALLEAPALAERAATLIALLEMSGTQSGPVTLN